MIEEVVHTAMELVGVDEDENFEESYLYRERGDRDKIWLGSMVGLSSMHWHMRCLPFGGTTLVRFRFDSRHLRHCGVPSMRAML